MLLGGWLRLLVVLTVLWGLAVALLAYDSRPRVENVRNAWVSEGLTVIAQRINEKEHSDIEAWQIENHESLNTSDKAIAYFERIEKSPTENQRLFSSELTAVNTRHRERISEIERGWPLYVAKSAAAWLSPMLGILVLGYAMGWVWRGFRTSKA